MLHANDRDHERCREFLETTTETLVVPSSVIVEVCQLAERLGGPDHEVAFLRSFIAKEMIIESVEVQDFERISELIGQYADFPLGMVDASVIALAERLGVSDVATLDHRHFSAVRPRHVEAFNLLP